MRSQTTDNASPFWRRRQCDGRRLCQQPCCRLVRRDRHHVVFLLLPWRSTSRLKSRRGCSRAWEDAVTSKSFPAPRSRSAAITRLTAPMFWCNPWSTDRGSPFGLSATSRTIFCILKDRVTCFLSSYTQSSISVRTIVLILVPRYVLRMFQRDS